MTAPADRRIAATSGDRVSGHAGRVAWLDGLRGLSIAAMICSHVGIVTGATPTWVHLYLLRPFAPLFLFLVGYLWRPGWRRRHWQLLGTAGVAQLLAWDLGFSTPNIVVLIVVAVGALHLAHRWPFLVMMLAVNQVVFWPLPEWWTGYPLGFVVLCAMAGQLVAHRIAFTDGFLIKAGTAAHRVGLGAIGRAPVRWYLGHLAVLVLATRWLP